MLPCYFWTGVDVALFRLVLFNSSLSNRILVTPASQPLPLVSSPTPKYHLREWKMHSLHPQNFLFHMAHNWSVGNTNPLLQKPGKADWCQSRHALLTLALKRLVSYSLDFPGRRDTNLCTNQTQGKHFKVLQVVLLKSHHLSWVEKNLALGWFSPKHSLNTIHTLLFRSCWGDWTETNNSLGS